MAETAPLRADIHAAIATVYQQVGFVKKERSREGDLPYKFAGEAAFIEALRPAMVAAGIYVSVIGVSNVLHEIYTTGRGTTMNRTALTATVRFTHAPSGTYIDAEARGEGADAGDKSTPKAMTGAYKYALRQTFMIETGDDPDEGDSRQQERAQPGSQPRGLRQCVDCNEPMLYKSGVKDGRAWAGWFCPNSRKGSKDHPPIWQREEEEGQDFGPEPAESVPYE